MGFALRCFAIRGKSPEIGEQDGVSGTDGSSDFFFDVPVDLAEITTDYVTIRIAWARYRSSSTS
jgi:hypothetical protein